MCEGMRQVGLQCSRRDGPNVSFLRTNKELAQLLRHKVSSRFSAARRVIGSVNARALERRRSRSAARLQPPAQRADERNSLQLRQWVGWISACL